MLITFSGVVGSGKSTAARYTVDALSRWNVRAKRFSFQSLDYFGWRRQPGRRYKSGSASASEVEPVVKRGLGYRRRRLTLGRAMGYMARALLFRAIRLLSAPQTCWVLNRYFYDNLAHYQLTTRLERLYLSVLKRLIRAPDLPFVLIASEKNIAERRPNYADAYVSEIKAGYRNLLQYFPELIVVRTDARVSMEETLDNALRSSVQKLGR